MAEQLSWIVPSEHMGNLVRCPERAYSTSACHLHGAERDSVMALEKPTRPGLEAQPHIGRQEGLNKIQRVRFTIPIDVSAFSVIISFVCGVIHSPVPIAIVLGFVLLWKVSFGSNYTKDIPPRRDGGRKHSNTFRRVRIPDLLNSIGRIRVEDLLSTEAPDPTRRIRVDDLLSDD